MLANILQDFASPLSKEQVHKIREVVDSMSLEQVNWLSGYLAGMSATGALAGFKTVESVLSGHQQDLINTESEGAVEFKATVLYASQTGNARGVAENVFDALSEKGIASELVDISDFKPKQIKTETYVILVVSTHGEGEPPDDAVEFYEFIHSKKAPKLDQLQFAILALGDSSYEHYCQTGKDFEKRFVELGAKNLLERTDLDVDYQSGASQWQSSVVDILNEKQADANQSSGNASHQPHLSVVTTPSTSKYSKFKPFSAEVVDVISVTGKGSVKPTYHLEVSLEESGLTYEPGDTLGIWPTNSDSLVKEVVEWLGVDASKETVVIDENTVLLETALKEHFELTQIAPALIKHLIETAPSYQGSELKALSEELIQENQVPDILKLLPTTLSVEALLGLLRRTTPRLYSIASSQKEVEEEVHLTIGLVESQVNESNRFGAVSGLVAGLNEGDTIKVYVEKNKHFKLPQSSDAPVIMIGAGTGIAPYRGFLQEREQNDDAGKNWLFFGNPHFTTDFLYQIEWQKWLKSGLLSKIDLAFSRDQAEKIYVQDRLKQRSAEVYSWIESGAYIYLCGDKDRLGQSVEQALIDIIAENKSVSEVEAKDVLKSLRKDGRYQKDVY